ncbi:MAG TPA: hypothetical protein ENK33_08885 [Desulfobacterales bacterium]|nr:hypothetical protein [Desulfobacterales bacterium]
MTNILNLNQKEFFSADQSFLTQRESQLLDMDFYGVAVNAPRRILTDRHAKLPLVIAVQYCGKRGWDVPLKNNGLLVGMNLRDGSVYFADIYQNKKRLANKWRAGKTHRGAYPPGLSLKAAVLKIVDVRQRLNLKWDTGIWAFGVLYYDWPSNTVIVKLQGREKAAPSPVIRVHPEPDPRDAAVLPTYLPTVNTPKALKSELKFTVQFKDEKDGQQLKVYGSFAVPVRDFNLPAHKRVRQFHDKKQQNIAAVIPITLVVLRLDQDEPLQFNWAVPVYGKPLKAGMQARGSFSIDALNTGAETKLGCGRYACYIFMDGRIFGPKIIDISTIKSVERPAVVPRPH